ncbi:acyl carrier protein [Streptomyces sp. NPDC059909]|uniref:acyl carrier protein n=1 Tax=Streptomyces sp. NPDC059909 TaxID=3346998 RepID=UPI00366185D0
MNNRTALSAPAVELSHEAVVDWITAFLAEILDITPNEIDPSTPLDHLGVDSATTLVICAGFREELGIQVRPRDVFDHFTADALARRLTGPLTGTGPLPAGV